jgi:hypothetical protein
MIIEPMFLQFIERLRDILRVELVNGLHNDTRPEYDIVYWYLALGTLSWDVAGSLSLLLNNGHLRAAMALNRSLFEYEIRLRYYAKNPTVAAKAIKQIPKRIEKIDRVMQAIGDDKLSGEDRLAAEEYYSKGAKAGRELPFRDMIAEVDSVNFAQNHYDFYYDRQSSYIHGYETIMVDVLNDFITRQPRAEPHWNPKILDADWIAIKGIEPLLQMILAIRDIRHLPTHGAATSEWVSILSRYGAGRTLKTLKGASS